MFQRGVIRNQRRQMIEMTRQKRTVFPRRFIAGADAIATAEQKVADLKAQIDAERDLSTSLDFDEVGSTRHGT